MTTTRIARIPYLNSAPFFQGLALGERYELTDCAPRALGAQAAEGSLLAGLMPLADYLRLEETFERVGRFGIAVRGRVRSVLLFSRKPLRQLDGAVIAVTEETSTTAVLLRLLLEQRYHISPAAYERGERPDAEALLLIGDAALKFQQRNDQYPFETDLAFEWWLWQHLPCVFAVWAIRKDAGAEEKKELELALSKSLGINLRQLERLAQDASPGLGVPAEALHSYLSQFTYRFGQPEEDGIAQFKRLVHEHHLL
ncbi:MAG: menaquinone biosynthesis protein [Candidatus Omnitrophica bacterium]|nr:menaquinone biosynthesis protein [Candidatus Omnitrophota bacterium]